MAKRANSASYTAEPERMLVMELVLDNPFLLLFLGVVIPHSGINRDR